jgi:pimeloyl-ACP methyl ester carboxylesterase
MVTFLLIGSALVSGSAVAAEPAGVEPVVPPIAWRDCPAGDLKDVPPEQVKFYSCGSYRVPIDHDNASLGTIDIGLMRRAAAKPETKIGSVFVNPGGPGGAGRRWAISFARRATQEILDRFDVIGFDPRGVGTSNPLRCFTTGEDAEELLKQQSAVPLSPDEISTTLAVNRDYGKRCEHNAGALLHHMSTRDVVRDLDVLRAAAGDKQLTFVGFSYGTLIGATYANMFPHRMRAFVLDGNVDPELRTNDGLTYDQERARGFEIALRAYFEACVSAERRCSFSDGDPVVKYNELRDYLRRQPIVLSDGTKITISSMTEAVSSALYRMKRFAPLADDLTKAYKLITGPGLDRLGRDDLPFLLDPPPATLDDTGPRSPYRGDDSYAAVNCSDKLFTLSQDEIPGLAARWERESVNFGRMHAFGDPATCSVWPARDPDTYRGPWNQATDVPIVVVGNLFDPATQYEFSRRMTRQLGNARLVSVDMIGHCALGDSAPLDQVVTRYLLTRQAPEADLMLKPNKPPFS